MDESQQRQVGRHPGHRAAARALDRRRPAAPRRPRVAYARTTDRVNAMWTLGDPLQRFAVLTEAVDCEGIMGYRARTADAPAHPESLPLTREAALTGKVSFDGERHPLLDLRCVPRCAPGLDPTAEDGSTGVAAADDGIFAMTPSALYRPGQLPGGHAAPEPNPVGARKSATLRGLRILTDQSTEAIAAGDLDIG